MTLTYGSLFSGYDVTDVPGITRNDMLKALGNGVVPPQAAAATRAWVADTLAEQGVAS